MVLGPNAAKPFGRQERLRTSTVLSCKEVEVQPQLRQALQASTCSALQLPGGAQAGLAAHFWQTHGGQHLAQLLLQPVEWTSTAREQWQQIAVALAGLDNLEDLT
jgi:hypothetical protein